MAENMELAFLYQGTIYFCEDLHPQMRCGHLRDRVMKAASIKCENAAHIKIFSLFDEKLKTWPEESVATSIQGREIRYTTPVSEVFPQWQELGRVHYRAVLITPSDVASGDASIPGDSSLDQVVETYNQVCERSRKRKSESTGKLAFSKFERADIDSLYSKVKRIKYEQETKEMPASYMDHLKREFEFRISTLGEPWTSSESQRRIFINSVLIACVAAANAQSAEALSIDTEVELIHNDVDGTGKADYVISKGDHMVIVIEAKKCDIGQGQTQNFAAMEAARIINGKNNSSWHSIQGICTDFQNWVFIRRNESELSLDHDSTKISSTFTDDMLRIASKVYGMLLDL